MFEQQQVGGRFAQIQQDLDQILKQQKEGKLKSKLQKRESQTRKMKRSNAEIERAIEQNTIELKKLDNMVDSLEKQVMITQSEGARRRTEEKELADASRSCRAMELMRFILERKVDQKLSSHEAKWTKAAEDEAAAAEKLAAVKEEVERKAKEVDNLKKAEERCVMETNAIRVEWLDLKEEWEGYARGVASNEEATERSDLAIATYTNALKTQREDHCARIDDASHTNADLEQKIQVAEELTKEKLAILDSHAGVNVEEKRAANAQLSQAVDAIKEDVSDLEISLAGLNEENRKFEEEIKYLEDTVKADDKATGEIQVTLDARQAERTRLTELVESLSAKNEMMEDEARKIRKSIDKDIAKNVKIHQQAQANLATAKKDLKKEEKGLEKAKEKLEEEKERGILLGELKTKRQAVKEAKKEKVALQDDIARLLDAEADFEKEIEDIVEEFPELADLGDAIDKGEKAGEAALEAIKSDCRARTAAALEACKEHDAKRREIMQQRVEEEERERVEAVEREKVEAEEKERREEEEKERGEAEEREREEAEEKERMEAEEKERMEVEEKERMEVEEKERMEVEEKERMEAEEKEREEAKEKEREEAEEKERREEEKKEKREALKRAKKKRDDEDKAKTKSKIQVKVKVKAKAKEDEEEEEPQEKKNRTTKSKAKASGKAPALARTASLLRAASATQERVVSDGEEDDYGFNFGSGGGLSETYTTTLATTKRKPKAVMQKKQTHQAQRRKQQPKKV
ncbi:hypothetical protein TrRE_jg6765, partial [Triparma retinervis]